MLIRESRVPLDFLKGHIPPILSLSLCCPRLLSRHLPLLDPKMEAEATKALAAAGFQQLLLNLGHLIDTHFLLQPLHLYIRHRCMIVYTTCSGRKGGSSSAGKAHLDARLRSVETPELL